VASRKNPARFRPPAVVKAASEEFKKRLEDLGEERKATDERIEKLRPALDRMKELQEGMDNKGFHLHLSVEEETIILEAHFSQGIGPKAIADVLGRPRSTISRFIQRYTSTAPIAQATLKAGARRLAERVLKHASVTESLEVLDRVDALPKKDRGKSDSGTPRFSIIVAMPGSPSAATAPVPQLPALPDIDVNSE
jgi:hypothetical protein